MQANPIDRVVALIVEDHDAVRAGLRELIQIAFARLHLLEARTVSEALERIDGQRVDIVLMDIGLPGTNGVVGTRMVLERSPETAVIMVSNFDDASYRGAARRAGARAFVSKRAIGKELLLAIESVMSEISRCRAGLALARTGTA